MNSDWPCTMILGRSLLFTFKSNKRNFNINKLFTPFVIGDHEDSQPIMFANMIIFTKFCMM
jgi:hypothetical protein